jgi:hypothetical protein
VSSIEEAVGNYYVVIMEPLCLLYSRDGQTTQWSKDGQTTQWSKEKRTKRRINNDLQSIHKKLKIEEHEPHLNMR